MHILGSCSPNRSSFLFYSESTSKYLFFESTINSFLTLLWIKKWLLSSNLMEIVFLALQGNFMKASSSMILPMCINECIFTTCYIHKNIWYTSLSDVSICSRTGFMSVVSICHRSWNFISLLEYNMSIHVFFLID